MRKKQNKGVRGKIITFILVILALNSFVEFSKGLEGKNYTIYPKATQESRMALPDLCELTDVVCEGEDVPNYNKLGEFTAYNTVEGQTDSTPFETADGTDTRTFEGCIVAHNDLPFGSIIEIEGIGQCTVKDRMNRRYTGLGRFDICMNLDLERAKNFGRKEINYKVIK